MISCGEIEVKIGEDVIYNVDIIVKNEIRKKSTWDYLKQLFNEIINIRRDYKIQ